MLTRWYGLIYLDVPDDKVDTDNTLRFVSAAVVDDSPLCLYPGIATVLGHKSVLPSHGLPLRKHCKEHQKKLFKYTMRLKPK